MMESVDAVIVIPRLRVEGFNITSAPFTWGAPAPSSWVGLMHALERTLPQGSPIEIVSIGSVVHSLTPHTHQGYVHTFKLTRNPVDKAGKTRGIVEEGRGAMDVSVVLGVTVDDEAWLTSEHSELSDAAVSLRNALVRMRIAGGTVWEKRLNAPYVRKPYVILPTGEEDGDEQLLRRFRRSMLPGFTLVSRHQWMHNRLVELRADDPSATMLDAWMDAGRTRWRSQPVDDESGKVEWVSSRPKGSGWIVPIPAGFVGITQLYEPGAVKNSRDPSVPFRFVEAAYSVGEWIGAHRIESFEDLLWYPETDHEAGTYICLNDYEKTHHEE